MKRTALLLLLAVLAIGYAFMIPDEVVVEGPHFSITSEDSTGAPSTQLATLFGSRVIDVQGNLIHLGLEDGMNPIGLVFVDPGCPISKRYIPRLNEIKKEADRFGAELYCVISDPTFTVAEGLQFQQEFDIQFPVIWDASGDLAMRLHPTVVPQCFVVNFKNEIVYSGRIDDRFPSVGKVRNNIANHNLLEALQLAAKGEYPEQRYHPAIGCVFESWKDGLPKQVTFNRDIDPILRANCTECHQPGGIGPFELMNYQDAKRRSNMIAFVVGDNRYMPPWKAEPMKGHFRDERILSPWQISLLKQWSKDGSPEGKAEDKITATAFVAKEWSLGTPDQVLSLPAPFSVPADGEDIYRYFVIRNPFKHDVMIRALDFKPGDPTVVHHANFLLDYGGRGRALDGKDGQTGFTVFGKGSFMNYDGGAQIGAWAPGGGAYEMPEGVAMYIPAGGDLLIEIHYHLSGKATTDQSKLGVYFSKASEVKEYADGLFIGTQDLYAPAGDTAYTRHLQMYVPADFKLVDITPHMHYIGKGAKVQATLPNNEVMDLLEVVDWDLRWQNGYTYREPVLLPKGTRIDAWFTFDNSDENSANPFYPPQDIRWGWETTEEMCELYMAIIPADFDRRDDLLRASRMVWYTPPNQRIEFVKDYQPSAAFEALMQQSLFSDAGHVELMKATASENYEDILRYFSKQEAKHKDNVLFHVNYGILLTMGASGTEKKSKMWDWGTQADKHFNKALQLNENSWDAYYGLCFVYAWSGDDQLVKESLKMLRELIKLQEQGDTEPHHYLSYWLLGETLEKAGEAEEAQKVWKRGQEQFPQEDRFQLKINLH